VPDQPYLYDKLTGREMLSFITDMYGMETRSAQACIEREIDRFNLGDFIDDLTESYSHGMKQRTVFASAMLHDPAVLVVDEPMVGLDPQSVRLVKDLLHDKAAAGTTVFMSTHTLAVAEEIADRIGIFNQGQLVFLGTLDELREQLAMEGQSLESLYLQLVSEMDTSSNGVPELTVGSAAQDELSSK
jgi:ABC-2 type transport system ATP-binding protein